MSIRPMDMQNIYLRMGEVSREQDKEIKKEDRERSFQKRIQKFREENSNQSVNQTRESQADQTVREHEDRGLPVHKKQHDQGQEQNNQEAHREFMQKSPLDLALPMVTLSDHTASGTKTNVYVSQDPFDPDLGHYVNIES